MMNAEVQRHLKEIYSLAKMMLAFLICFFSFQAQTPAKLIFERTEKHGLSGIKITLTESLELKGNFPNSFLNRGISLIVWEP